MDTRDAKWVRWPTFVTVTGSALAASLSISWAGLQQHAGHLHLNSVDKGEYHRTVDRLEAALDRIDGKLDSLLSRDDRSVE